MTTNEIIKKIKNATKIAIFTHLNPDPDAYGAAFSVQEICQDLGKTADVISLGDGGLNLEKIFPLERLKSEFIPEEYDLVIVVDLHAIDRLDEPFRQPLKVFKNVVLIDHHEDMKEPTLDFAQKFIQPEKAAVCEIICDICIKEKIEIKKQVATYLWAGLIGDTGRFLHSNLSENVLETAKVLFKSGADAQKVYDVMFRSVSHREMELHCDFLGRIRYVCGGRGAYVIYTQKDLKKLHAVCQDIKEYVSELAQIDGVNVGILCVERSKNDYKFSVRCNNVNALGLVSRLGGGGHENASGFQLDITKKEIERKLPVWIAEILGFENFIK